MKQDINKDKLKALLKEVAYKNIAIMDNGFESVEHQLANMMPLIGAVEGAQELYRRLFKEDMDMVSDIEDRLADHSYDTLMLISNQIEL